MSQVISTLPAKLFLGRGIDKKFPYLVDVYKKAFTFLASEKDIKVNIPQGLKIYVSTKDCGLGMYLRTKGEYEPIQTKTFLDSLKPGLVVFDIGANVGYYTVLASKKVGKTGKVYAFEPDPKNLRLLKRNLRLNECNNVVIIDRPVSNEEIVTALTLDKANPGESRLGKGAKGLKIAVKTLPLDFFVRRRKVKHVDVIKMDIEGAEILALEGGREFLNKSNKIKVFLECNTQALSNFGKKPEDLLKVLKVLNFQIKGIINESAKLTLDFSPKRFHQALKEMAYFGLIAQK